MEEPSINILTEAKTEYTKQLTNFLAPLIKEGFNQLYEDACNFKDTTNDPRFDDYSELQIFQDYLRKIPKWNQDLIDQETNRIKTKSRCEYLEDLIGAVFVSYAKVLSVIRLRNPTSQMKLKIPKLRNFIHKCYIECSREIYQNVYLFDNEDISNIEKQKNIRDINNIVKDGIIEAVRKLLPVKDIIKTYLGKIYDDEETDISTVDNGFEQSAFMDFAKNNLRKNVEEIQSENEIDESDHQDESDHEEESDHQENFEPVAVQEVAEPVAEPVAAQEVAEPAVEQEIDESFAEAEPVMKQEVVESFAESAAEERFEIPKSLEQIVPEPSGESVSLSKEMIERLEQSETYTEQKPEEQFKEIRVREERKRRFKRNKDRIREQQKEPQFVSGGVQYEEPF